MLKTILISLAVVIVVFVVVVARRPDTFRMSRSITILAPPAVVFGHVNDLHQWQEWSPWAKMDPNAKMTYEGPVAGPGASYHWAGNKEVGEGTMSITESRPVEFIQFKLEFQKPFAATNMADFTFKAEGDQTVVTWGMSGTNNFLFKAVGLFMDCDKMVGPQFEKGLAGLKTIAEAEARK